MPAHLVEIGVVLPVVFRVEADPVVGRAESGTFTYIQAGTTGQRKNERERKVAGNVSLGCGGTRQAAQVGGRFRRSSCAIGVRKGGGGGAMSIRFGVECVGVYLQLMDQHRAVWDLIENASTE